MGMAETEDEGAARSQPPGAWVRVDGEEVVVGFHRDPCARPPTCAHALPCGLKAWRDRAGVLWCVTGPRARVERGGNGWLTWYNRAADALDVRFADTDGRVTRCLIEESGDVSVTTADGVVLMITVARCRGQLPPPAGACHTH
jgi:hypothetical protein